MKANQVPTDDASVVDDLGDLRVLLPDFERSLRAENKADRTVRIYGDSARRLVAFLVEQGMPTDAGQLTRDHIESFVADQLQRWKPATASQRYRALAQFFKWMVEEGEITVSPMARMKPPRVPEVAVPLIRGDALHKLLRACEGTDFDHRRDTALVRMLVDTGVRAGEIMNLKTDDIDRHMQVAMVIGKGRRPRSVPYGNKTAQSLDRYLRTRSRHPKAKSPWLWLGRGGHLTDWGLRQMLNRRAIEAGVDHVYPHQFRHTFAHDYLSAGGGETSLMQLAGWRSRAMLSRYGASAAAERARDEYRHLGIGDRL